jgi:hypothetical protein
MSTIKTYGQIKEAYEKKYINEAIESNDSTRFDVKLQEFDAENGNLCRYDGNIVMESKLKELDQAMRQKYGVF